MKNFISWKKLNIQCIKYQSKIRLTQMQPRKCRNFQRLLRRASFCQLYIIRQFLYEEIQYNLILRNHLFQFQYSRSFFHSQIINQLWIFALSPLIDFQNLKILTGKTSATIYKTVCQIFQFGQFSSLIIYKIQNFLSQKNKLWILTNLLIEKKVFLKWLKNQEKSHNQQRIIYFTNFQDRMSLKQIFQYFSITALLNSVWESFFPKRCQFMEYHCFLLVCMTKDYQKIQSSSGLNLKFLKKCSLHQGIHFLGLSFWQNGGFHTSISRQNLHNHQEEFKNDLKKALYPSQPVDQIIDQLNTKIRTWQKFYSFLQKEPAYQHNYVNELNDYLFWRIWYWSRQRHRHKGSKWLYKRYWKKSTSAKWRFSNNHVSLICYQ